MKRIIVSVLIIFFMLQFCKKTEIEYFKIEMIDGIKVIHNFNIEPENAYKDLAFIEDLSIGVVVGDENYMFNYPVDVESDREGNVYVLDYMDCVIKKYNPDGKFIKEFGGKGQGPGEFQAAYCMFISPQNELYVKDSGANKIVLLSQEGEYQKAYTIEMRNYFKPRGNEEFIVDYSYYNEDGVSFLCVGRVGFQKSKPEPILCERQYWPARWMSNEFVYEYPYFIRWEINSYDQIYAASAVGYEVNVFDSAGSLQFKFKKEYDPVPLEGEELKKITEMQDNVSMDRGPNPYNTKLVYPAFKFIAIDEEDRVWIEHYQPVWRNKANEETIYDVFSPEGIFQFTAKIPGHIHPQLTFKNDFIYALKKDESGYSKAVRIKFVE